MIIIKPFNTTDELVQYFTRRRANFEHNFPEISEASISKDENFEMDAYDLFSFHYGAFKNGKLIGAVRMVNDTQSNREINCGIYHNLVTDFIREYAHPSIPNFNLALIEHAKSSEDQIAIKNYFRELNESGVKFAEIGRFNNSAKEISRLILKALISYAYAFARFNHIDHAYFDASPLHCAYYKRSFNCERVLANYELNLNPSATDKMQYIMIASPSEVPVDTDRSVNNILAKFKHDGTISGLTLDQIECEKYF